MSKGPKIVYDRRMSKGIFYLYSVTVAMMVTGVIWPIVFVFGYLNDSISWYYFIELSTRYVFLFLLGVNLYFLTRQFQKKNYFSKVTIALIFLVGVIFVASNFTLNWLNRHIGDCQNFHSSELVVGVSIVLLASVFNKGYDIAKKEKKEMEADAKQERKRLQKMKSKKNGE